MRILVIGGTVFLGRHLTEAALAAGHEVTLFHRGVHGSDLFPQVQTITGDRTSDLSRLDGTWDVVIDTCGYFPRDVAASAQHLSSRVDRYVFVSTLSVYSEGFTTPGVDETGSLLSANPDDTEVTGENYGGLKALCEAAAEEAMPGRVFIPRPGLIVGPFDQSDRFTYWVARCLKGGDILAPGPADDPTQWIDVRDLAEWIVRLVEQGETGIFNATGPDFTLSLETVLETGLRTCNGDGRLVWVDGAWLKDQGVGPWVEVPLWIPDAPGFAYFDIQKAMRSGLTFRPLEDTFSATLDWLRTRPEDHEWRAGLSPEKEATVLQAWATRTSE